MSGAALVTGHQSITSTLDTVSLCSALISKIQIVSVNLICEMFRTMFVDIKIFAADHCPGAPGQCSASVTRPEYSGVVVT